MNAKELNTLYNIMRKAGVKTTNGSYPIELDDESINMIYTESSAVSVICQYTNPTFDEDNSIGIYKGFRIYRNTGEMK